MKAEDTLGWEGIERSQSEVAIPQQPPASVPALRTDRSAEMSKSKTVLQQSVTAGKLASLMSFLDEVADEVGILCLPNACTDRLT
jgi:hypothetical protein